MAHVRKQIRDALATAVTNLATTGTDVFPSRVAPLPPARLPALRIYATDEDSTAVGIGPNPPRERTVEIAVEAVAAAVEGLDDTLDAICAEVETALGNTTLGGLVKSLENTGTRIEFDGEGEQPVGVARMTWSATYFTLSNAPETAL